MGGSAVFTERAPDMREAREVWGGAWSVYLYVTAILHFLLFVLGTVNTVLQVQGQARRTRRHCVALSLLVAGGGLVRGLYFSVDAYNLDYTFPLPLALVLATCIYPCLTSAFLLLFIVIFFITRKKMLSHKFHAVSSKVSIFVIVFNFVFAITADVVTAYAFDYRYLRVACAIYFILWGFVLSILYFIAYFRVQRTVNGSRKMLRQLSGVEERDKDICSCCPLYNRQTTMQPQRVNKSSFIYLPYLGGHRSSRSARLTLGAASLFLLLTCLSVYSLVTSALPGTPRPWPWLAAQAALRAVELSMAALVLAAAWRPPTPGNSAVTKPGNAGSAGSGNSGKLGKNEKSYLASGNSASTKSGNSGWDSEKAGKYDPGSGNFNFGLDPSRFEMGSGGSGLSSGVSGLRSVSFDLRPGKNALQSGNPEITCENSEIRSGDSVLGAGCVNAGVELDNYVLGNSDPK